MLNNDLCTIIIAEFQCSRPRNSVEKRVSCASYFSLSDDGDAEVPVDLGGLRVSQAYYCTTQAGSHHWHQSTAARREALAVDSDSAREPETVTK
jgi:hypothetical protein